MKKELQKQIAGTLGEHQNIFNEWLNVFNTIRPHEVLNMKVLVDAYKKSERKYTDEYIEINYEKVFKTRYVNDRDYINWDNKHVFIGYHVGIKNNVDTLMEE